MRTTPSLRTEADAEENPAAERERAAAWQHLARPEEEGYDLNPAYWPGARLAEVAERFDDVVENAYVSALGDLSPTDLLAALLVIRRLRDDFTVMEGHLIEAARKQDVTWTRLAPALEVKSRQAAERRHLRLCGNAYDANPGRTQRERVDNERDNRAERRAEQQWIAEHADEVRALAVRLAAVEDLQERADSKERAWQNEMNDQLIPLFPQPPFIPARWPADLAQAIERDDVPQMFAETRNATLPNVISLDGHEELVADIIALHRGASGAGLTVLQERWNRRYGPEPDEDDTE
ncbi:hypothetical protein ACWF9B_00975 [Streptomyces sp. NPDC055089]